ncbi:MAG: hypothetical protein RBG1_1C00001G0940 [candidate division Zixibacteria bacterium RBG-1]|nr:MAG: hypothetical protein RBG1_1C00001G0940 [candidate division Zixibacteria bacterium RBG-1]OGC83848.1 MAG: hypothetical protein A2V73_00215 [candidate division Zixibacteria bacterium RBG_19FT_COMBO_42_43]
MTVDFKNKIEKDFQPFVIKPGRYIGNEWGVIKKAGEGKCSLALAYPAIYDFGVSNSELNYLYHVINQNLDWVAERVFLPAKDAEKVLRTEKLPLFSMENFTPLKEFDVLLFILTDELKYPSVLNMLDLAEIPIYAKERENKYPLIAGYGKSALNPEPVADFFDFFILGDDEEIINKTLNRCERAKTEDVSKGNLLVSLSQRASIYVPSFYEIKNCDKSPKPKSKEVPGSVSVMFSENLKNYSEKKIVPLVETEGNGLSITAGKGEETVKQIQNGLENSGDQEVLIRVPQDYENFSSLLRTLWEKFANKRVSFFFPDLNPLLLTPEVIKLLAEQKRASISLATLGISDRLRNFLNQKITSEQLLAIIDNIYQYQFKGLKLSLYLGVPHETEQDIEELEKFLAEVNKINKKSQNDINLAVSFKIFLPLPNTQWQWDKLEDLENLRAKISYLKLNLNFRNMRINFPDEEKVFLRGILARGDRKLAPVIHKVWGEGLKSESEENIFNFSDWQKTFQENCLKMVDYSSAKNHHDILAWEHIQVKDKQKLIQARLEVDERLKTPIETCFEKPSPAVESLESPETDAYGRKRKIVQKKTATSLVNSKVRLQWSKSEEVRFTSHLDVIRMFEKTFRKAKIPLEYSQGFHPHQKVSFGPPLPIGFVSSAEYLDLQLETPFKEDFLLKLNSSLPPGFEFLQAKVILGKTVSLSESINLASYEVELPFFSEQIKDQISYVLERKDLIANRVKKESTQELDIRPFIVSLEAEKINAEKTDLKMLLVLTPLGYARPQEVLQYGLGLGEKEISRLPIKRTGLYCKKEDKLLTPMELVY